MSFSEQARRLLEPCRTVILVTADEGGRPDARAMATVKVDGLKTVWMVTGKQSDKYKELTRNPECMLYATDMEDTTNYLELRLWGKMELLDDPASRALAWRDDYLCYFPGGQDDPGMVVLKFTANAGTLQTQAGKEKLAF